MRIYNNNFLNSVKVSCRKRRLFYCSLTRVDKKPVQYLPNPDRMPSVRLSSEAVQFLKQAKNQNNFQVFKAPVSVVRDDEEPDFESESEEADALVITPRLKAHTRRIYELQDDEVIHGEKVFIPPPVSNLSKRFSSSSLGTPSRILQLAFEKKANEGDSHQKSDEELVVSNADTDGNTKHSKNQVEKHTSLEEPIKKGRVVRKRITKEQQVKVSVDEEAEFKVPKLSRRRKNAEQLEKQPKAANRRGKNKQVEEEDVPAQGTGLSDDSEYQVANPPYRKLRRGNKALEDPKIDAAPTISPSKLINVKVTIENVPSASLRRDVSLPENNFKNTSTIDDTIDSVIGNLADINESPVPAQDTRYARRRKDLQEITDDIHTFDDYVAEKNKSLVKGGKNSKRRMNAQEVTEESEDNAGFVTKRRGKARKSDSSPIKRLVRNRKTKKPLQEEEDLAISNGEQNYVDNAESSSSNQIIPQFSSDHEEDRSTMSSPPRDSPIITKSNRLSKALVTKSPSNGESSDSSPPLPRRRLSTIPSRSPSTSPDMFTPSPTREKTGKESRASYQKAKGAQKLLHLSENDATPLTRSKLRASLGARTPTATEALPIQSSSDQTTPLQLEAVGLVRKPTPLSIPRTPPRQSILPSATTPLSSRNLTIPSEPRPANQEANQDTTNSLKRKQTAHTFVTTPKRQRVQTFSPMKTQETENSDATPRTRQQAKNISPKKLQEPTSIGTHKSPLAPQRTKNASPEKLQEPININTEETLPCMANIDQLQIEGLSVSAAHIAKNSGKQGSNARSEESGFEQTITRRTNISENMSLVPIPTMQPVRFNAYSANTDDPVRATQLLATDEYRVSWLHILPKCSFYFRVRSKTMVVVISGVILISGDCNQRGLVLNSKSRVAELNVGALCQAVNTGETLSIFQVTESLL